MKIKLLFLTVIFFVFISYAQEVKTSVFKFSSEIRLYVGLPYGTHNIGHSFIRVSTGDSHGEVIYDFGRYGKSWGYLNFSGEGIMRVWRGRKAVDFFLKKQQRFRDFVEYRIKVSPEVHKKVYEHYESLLKNAKLVEEHPNHKRFRLKRDFDGVTVQCTSMALEGLRLNMNGEDYISLLDPGFNKGKGFTEKQKSYYFKVQRQKKIDHVAVPLDVIESLDHALKNKHRLLGGKKYFKKIINKSGSL